ncbi:MAG: carboxypeptidase-like regulatory domain-containing protein [Prevotellaceae bacterium]|jgi:hypothetical protein|nr:carboxypeptidase-like regulatory domain-containing protein [Prevotellaceae bacterium]
MKNKYLIYSLFCCIIMAGCTDTITNTHTINGKITDYSDGTAISGVSVTAISEDGTLTEYATSDDNGFYQINNLLVGFYNLDFVKNGYDVFTGITGTIVLRRGAVNCDVQMRITETTPGVSNAAVTISDIMSISDGIGVWYSLNSSTKYYYVSSYTATELNNMTNAQIISDLTNNGLRMDKTDSYQSTIHYGLTASTSYTVCAVAYDSQGRQGSLTKKAISTKSASTSQPYATISLGTISGGKVYFNITKNSYCSYYVNSCWINQDNLNKPDVLWAAALYELRNDPDYKKTENKTDYTWYYSNLAGNCIIVSLAFNSSGTNGGLICKRTFNANGTVYSVPEKVPSQNSVPEKKMMKFIPFEDKNFDKVALHK